LIKNRNKLKTKVKQQCNDYANFIKLNISYVLSPFNVLFF